MGVRTVHQVDPKAQLVVSTSHSHEENGYASGEDSYQLDSMSLGSQVESSELKGLTAESDVLSAPKLVDGSGRVLDRSLGGLEQAVLLGWAQQVKKGTSVDELQVWTASGFASRCTIWCKLVHCLVHLSLNLLASSVSVVTWRPQAPAPPLPAPLAARLAMWPLVMRAKTDLAVINLCFDFSATRQFLWPHCCMEGASEVGSKTLGPCVKARHGQG